MGLRLLNPSGFEFYCDSLYQFPAGTVLMVQGDIWLIVRNDSQWGAINQKKEAKTLLKLEWLIRWEGVGVVIYTPDTDTDEYDA